MNGGDGGVQWCGGLYSRGLARGGGSVAAARASLGRPGHVRGVEGVRGVRAVRLDGRGAGDAAVNARRPRAAVARGKWWGATEGSWSGVQWLVVEGRARERRLRVVLGVSNGSRKERGRGRGWHELGRRRVGPLHRRGRTAWRQWPRSRGWRRSPRRFGCFPRAN